MKKINLAIARNLHKKPIYLKNFSQLLLLVQLIDEKYCNKKEMIDHLEFEWKRRKLKDSFIRFTNNSVYNICYAFNYRNYNPDRYQILDIISLLKYLKTK